ncbi:hypothetical protein H632_c31p1 [Helicosporidium sp. ATCC 50920]|nr:hypothetical protein H632_c31p1 [Helicosporidium sp. ATCC 50920]|eukprot:KDD77052.1 hypothetical protein H632_c31p1 [Helicosporidium sp. ATCC 50920]
MSLTIADAVARNATETAVDLIYQSLMRSSSVDTTFPMLDLMVRAVGCVEPLSSILRATYMKADESGASVIFSNALRGISFNIASFSTCFHAVTQ